MMQFRIIFILLFYSVCWNASAQNLKEKDLVKNDKVFFDEQIQAIQNNASPISDQDFKTLHEAIKFYQSAKDNCSSSHASALLARMHNNLGNNDSAIVHYIFAAKNLQSSCSSLDKYYLYNSWAILEMQIDEYKMSDSLFSLALKNAENLADKTYLLNVKTNQSILYSNQDNYKDAIDVMEEVNTLAKLHKSEHHQLLSLQNLGAYYIDLQKYDSSLFYLNQLLVIIDTGTSPRVAMDLYNNLGVIYDHKNNFDDASTYFLKAIALARKNENLNGLLTYLKNYSSLKNRTGEHAISRRYLKEYIDLKDKLFNEEKFEILKDLETQYQTAKQKEKILQLEKNALKQNLEIEKKRKNRNTLIFVVIGLFLVLVGVFSRLRYIRRSKLVVEREKKRSDDLLLNILPSEVAEELKKTGTSEARDFENVTVLFTDFKDFTSASETMQAKELVDEVNFYFKSFDEIITKYRIEKIKTIGDSYMAACGIPVQIANTAETMLKAAFEMHAIVAKRNAENRKNNKTCFEMRIGMHTGPIVAGIVGVKKFQYDIWGDTVNIASRMESHSEIGKINVSQYVYELLHTNPAFRFENRGLIEVKGKGKMEMFYVYQE